MPNLNVPFYGAFSLLIYFILLILCVSVCYSLFVNVLKQVKSKGKKSNLYFKHAESKAKWYLYFFSVNSA